MAAATMYKGSLCGLSQSIRDTKLLPVLCSLVVVSHFSVWLILLVIFLIAMVQLLLCLLSLLLWANVLPLLLPTLDGT